MLLLQGLQRLDRAVAVDLDFVNVLADALDAGAQCGDAGLQLADPGSVSSRSLVLFSTTARRSHISMVCFRFPLNASVIQLQAL